MMLSRHTVLSVVVAAWVLCHDGDVRAPMAARPAFRILSTSLPMISGMGMCRHSILSVARSPHRISTSWLLKAWFLPTPIQVRLSVRLRGTAS